VLDLDYVTPAEWVDAVLADLDSFLRDHAANERKASAAAMRLVVHHHDIPSLVDAMVRLADEEMQHFRQVYAILRERDAGLGQDFPDPYMTRLHGAMRKRVKSEFLLDRLVVFSIIEARGCERFGMLADALEDGRLKRFYADLTRAEARHRGLFVRLARELFDAATVTRRVNELVAVEAEIAASLPLRSVLH
jgi:tRNA-(ms[2]io[6]A)-hydroxylase